MSEVPAKSSDQIARYIFSKNDFADRKVKHSAFMPPEKHPSELSVCVTTTLDKEKIWNIGVNTRPNRTLKAWADLSVEAVQNTPEVRLQVLIDGIPHKNHANIKTLPLDIAKRRAAATHLSNKSKLVIYSG